MVRFTNNASTKLLSAITATDTELTVISGTGVRFPALTEEDWFYVTLVNDSTSPGAFEIVKVTARNADTFTIERAQDGTTAQDFASGDIVSLRVTAGALEDVYMSSGQYLRKQIVAAPGVSMLNIYLDAIAGDDTNDGLSAATPIKTLYRLRSVMDRLDVYAAPDGSALNFLTINFAAGNYDWAFSNWTAAIFPPSQGVASFGKINLVGAGDNLCFIENSVGQAISLGAFKCAEMEVSGLCFRTTVCVHHTDADTLFHNCTFQPVATSIEYGVIWLRNGGTHTRFLAGNTIDFTYCPDRHGVFFVERGAHLVVLNDVTTVGSVTLANGFIYVAHGALVQLTPNNVSFVGATVTGRKLWISNNASSNFVSIYSNTIPGDKVGIVMPSGTADFRPVAYVQLRNDGATGFAKGIVSATRTGTGLWTVVIPCSDSLNYTMRICSSEYSATSTVETKDSTFNASNGTKNVTVQTKNSAGALTNLTASVLVFE